jgi:microcin C transport system substrate-binding protein
MRTGKIQFVLLFVISVIFLSGGCGKKENTGLIDTQPVSIKTFNVPPGTGSDVPPNLGGNGFRGEGWSTSINYNSPGDEDAVKGGSITTSVNDFPLTLRNIGKDANTSFNRMVESLLYETLLNLDPVNNNYIPGLATHWQILEDGKTFRFRINPDSRFADGKPVTSEDVIATWKLITNPDILSPYDNILYGNYEMPVAESRYILQVRAKNLDWRNFLYFACALRVLPAHYIGNISGGEYLEKYKYEFIPGSGPYVILKDDISKENFIALRRRNDYWAENQRFSRGLNNFDFIKFEVIRDENLEIEKLKKGEIDILPVFRSSVWQDKLNVEQVEKGYLVKKRIFNQYPGGVSGLVMNMRVPPFNDINVRKAFFFCYNREQFNEKLFSGAYKLMHSFFPSSEYENLNNPHIGFSLDSAKKYLSDAGWSEKNQDGFLVKDGKIFEVELPFVRGMDRYLTIYKEDLRKLGINLNLREIDAGMLGQILNERNFTIAPVSLSGTQVPNPDAFFLSSLADENNNLNYSGIKDANLDELCKKFGFTFDGEERIKILKKIDSIACSYYPVVFGWYASYQRMCFRNKFGYPECGFPRFGSYLSFLQYWYYDPLKNKELVNAIAENDFLQADNSDLKFWGDR